MQPISTNLRYVVENLRNKNNMSKILRVIEPFFVMELNDTFTLSEDGKVYTSEHNEEFHTAKEDGDMTSSYNSKFAISPKWAQQLIEDGYLEEVDAPKDNKFVNVFDEIDNLIDRYQKELKEIPMMLSGQPECLKVEKTTVLTNILSVLNHLKSLRK